MGEIRGQIELGESVKRLGPCILHLGSFPLSFPSFPILFLFRFLFVPVPFISISLAFLLLFGSHCFQVFVLAQHTYIASHPSRAIHTTYYN
jgi:hypothetical protein